MRAPAYCPHCLLTLADDVTHPYPPQPQRCGHCHLLVGPGRAKAQADGDPGMRGSAAGVYASAARNAGAEPADEKTVAAAIREAAEKAGCRVERLPMLEYQRIAGAGGLPALDEVLATFGSWKAARRHAAGREPIRAV